MRLYKFTFGEEGIRGIEYASHDSIEVIKGLWGHKEDLIYFNGVNDIGDKVFTIKQDMMPAINVTCHKLPDSSFIVTYINKEE